MFSVLDHGARLCDGISRREVLRAGGLGLIGLSAAQLDALRAQARESGTRAPRAKRCIVLFLLGGPPQQSTWDPKPDSPPEVRGQFGPIDTSVPGIQISELFPNVAPLMHHVALLRAVSTGDNAHSSSGYQMMTGVPHIPLNAENANPGFPNDFPTLGAVIQHLRPGGHLLPSAVRLPCHIFNTDLSTWPGQDAGFLGHTADPWLLRCRPADPDFEIPHFRLQADVPLGRIENRRSLLEQLEGQLRAAERAGRIGSFGEHQQRAFELLGTERARDACRLDLEPDALRDQYGRSQFGQSVLLARRLVEAGVSLVQVNWYRGPDEPPANPCWDSHTDETNRLKNVLCPPLDKAFAALIGDLHQRGMLDDTLVVCTAEFGRTPRFNPSGGRDHWGSVFSIALAGGGIRGGTVYGASDAIGAFPKADKTTPQEITATIFDRLGIDPHTLIHDAQGRPYPITTGQPIDAILA